MKSGKRTVWACLLALSTSCAPSQPTSDVEQTTQAATALGTYQAENAVVVGAKILNTSGGFTGTGYVDYQNNSGDYIEWTINAPSTAQYQLVFRYANGATTSRSLELEVNGVVVNGAVAFAPTGAWTTWKTVTLNAALNSGAKVRLTATGSNGPNIDNLVVNLLSQAPIVSELGSPSDDNTPTWTWASGGGIGNGTFRYKLDSVDFSIGTTTTTAKTYTAPLPLANGVHTLYVQEQGTDLQWSATSIGSGVDIQVHLPYADSGQLAADAAYSGPVLSTTFPGFLGIRGYLDFQNASGDYIEFTAAVPKDGVYKVAFRYANGGTTSRPLKVTVNGITAKSSLAFPPTGSWSTWVKLNVDLPLVPNAKLRLTAIGSSGGNFDSFYFNSGTPMPPEPLVQVPPSPVIKPFTVSWTSQDPEGTGQFRFLMEGTLFPSAWRTTTSRSVTFDVGDVEADSYVLRVQEWNKWGVWGHAAYVEIDVTNPGPFVRFPDGNSTGWIYSWATNASTGIYRWRLDDGPWSEPTHETQVTLPCPSPSTTHTFQVEELVAPSLPNLWSLPGSVTFSVSHC